MSESTVDVIPEEIEHTEIETSDVAIVRLEEALASTTDIADTYNNVVAGDTEVQTPDGVTKDAHDQQAPRREPLVSQQEAMDIRMGPQNVKGWNKYWMQRLRLEHNILPSNIQYIISRRVSGKSVSDFQQTTLVHYVQQRTRILEYNVQKRQIMFQLKERLGAIDRHEGYAEAETKDRRIVAYDPSLDSLYVYHQGHRQLITLGTIAGDAEWGLRYTPDDSVPDRLWRKIRKLSDVTEARQSIERVFNRELSRVHGVNEPTTAISVVDVESRIETDNGINGVIAERMAKNYLRTLAFDQPELDLEVENSNALEDAELKYDFKVRVTTKRRGIAVAPDDMTREEYIEHKKRIGIQFTVSRSGDYKERQVRKAKEKIHDPRMESLVKKPVDDIVLVRLPFNAKTLFQQWTKAGKPSGGPEQYLTREQKIAILQKVTGQYSQWNATEIEKIIT